MIVQTLPGLAAALKGCALSDLRAPTGRFLEIPLSTRFNQSIAPQIPQISDLVSPTSPGAVRRRSPLMSDGA
jgi:hypothetical protein